MPLIFKTRDVPIYPENDCELGAFPVGEETSSKANTLKVALVVNMPDAALEDTESQFIGLLNAAASDLHVELSLYSLPNVPRGDRVKKHMENRYFGLRELLGGHFDGVIVTGTEPHHPDLSLEPYWNELTEVLDWAEECTSSAILSCLAAHAGVLHSDGIPRVRLEDKRFGVFSEAIVAEHALTRSIASPICFPHSRWNDLRPDDLSACGYSVLTKSAAAGVGVFVKVKKNSLFVHFQGHPEYGGRTLLKEYRRDVKRFLRKERETYPTLPQEYFNDRAAQILDAFRAEALINLSEEMLEKFPESLVAETLENTWLSSSVSIYRNWLEHMSIGRLSGRHEPTSLHADH